MAEASSDGLRYLFEIAKNEIEAQFKIAERLDAKARGLFALAGAIFAAAQALALRQDVLDGLSKADRGRVVTIATVAGAIVGAALLATAVATFVRREKKIEPSYLMDKLNALVTGRTGDAGVSRDAVRAYIDLAYARQGMNRKRTHVMWAVQLLCIAAIAASVVELIVALDGLA